MNWVTLQLAKWLGHPDRLQNRGVTKADVLGDVTDKTVAVIGNARSLSRGDFGRAIDNTDVVVRINTAPIPATRTHGKRTTWLAMSTPVAPDIIAQRNPKRILWMTRKRKRLPLWLVNDARFYLNAHADAQHLAQQIAGPPTTGLMVIDLLAASAAKRIDLYGFDFFASLSLSGRRNQSQVPHDFSAEKAYVMDLIAKDPRFHLIQSPD